MSGRGGSAAGAARVRRGQLMRPTCGGRYTRQRTTWAPYRPGPRQRRRLSSRAVTFGLGFAGWLAVCWWLLSAARGVGLQ